MDGLLHCEGCGQVFTHLRDAPAWQGLRVHLQNSLGCCREYDTMSIGGFAVIPETIHAIHAAWGAWLVCGVTGDAVNVMILRLHNFANAKAWFKRRRLPLHWWNARA